MSASPRRMPRWSATSRANSGKPRPEKICIRFLVTTSIASPEYALRLLFRPSRPSAFSPAFDDLLLGSLDCQRVGGYVLGDRRTRTGDRAPPDRHGCDEHRVRADEHVVFDLRSVLVEAVVVAGDGAGADV